MKWLVNGAVFFGIWLAFLLACPGMAIASGPDFDRLHRDCPPVTKDMVLKKVLYLSGMMTGAYHGLNDLVAGLQLLKENSDPKFISAQLFAVKVGLETKPELFRYLARELATIEHYPNFPLGFPDSPAGPEPFSVEMTTIADHLEMLDIQFQSSDPKVLRKEAERVVFSVFWTDCEKVRTLTSDLLTFVQKELKEEIPFEIYAKPLKRK